MTRPGEHPNFENRFVLLYRRVRENPLYLPRAIYLREALASPGSNSD